ncbi:ATP-binding response regulator [Azospirillum soli]|uniref:ATP-binding response regulator n=1 Tax=Azospirillum soli TaxID=1304799 RepID=UPI001AE0ED6A|nr:response regulator [Azospirillum soli]MBP2314974.1 CheY-like chemotaxis protein [Azospirillum soli]
MADPISALVVDDEEMSRAIVAGYLGRMGYRTLGAATAEEAWRILADRQETIHVILLDRQLPGMDGMEFFKRLKADPDLGAIPVIMQTVSDSSAEIAEAIQAGVFYYLIKPYAGDLLRSVASAAVEDYAHLTKLQGDVRSRNDAMALMRDGTFHFRTPQEAHNLAIAVSSIIPNTRKLAFGLMELLMNAVEHGNLGIGYEAKSELKMGSMLSGEIERRLALPENLDKTATLRVARDDARVVFTVTDQGRGFDWTRYLAVDAFRSSATHGRGIALARMVSFDELIYEGSGNTVVGVVDLARAG